MATGWPRMTLDTTHWSGRIEAVHLQYMSGHATHKGLQNVHGAEKTTQWFSKCPLVKNQGIAKFNHNTTTEYLSRAGYIFYIYSFLVQTFCFVSGLKPARLNQTYIVVFRPSRFVAFEMWIWWPKTPKRRWRVWIPGALSNDGVGDDAGDNGFF